jgi:hypothetical protein
MEGKGRVKGDRPPWTQKQPKTGTGADGGQGGNATNEPKVRTRLRLGTRGCQKRNLAGGGVPKNVTWHERVSKNVNWEQMLATTELAKLKEFGF